MASKNTGGALKALQTHAGLFRLPRNYAFFETSNTRFTACLLKCSCCLALTILALTASAQDPGNGIHVGPAKVYDSRQLTIMLDSLSQSLRGMSFINQGALANALGNVQGYQNTDTSSALFLNGAVGPQAAAVFANNLPAGSAASSAATAATSTMSSAPTFTINVNTPASSTIGTAGSSTTTSPTGYGPSAPTLPTLQTAPTYNPSFGPSSGDLLNDETNLTYQIFNLSMLLNRSLTDRIYMGNSRLQAVVGFDIDIEPDAHAQGAVAVVEITASMNTCPAQKDLSTCNVNQRPEVVALMPEQGSHNAATLTQKANSFGGALAAQVFSVGLAGQKRSQTFYLYRDIDTISLQEPDLDQSSRELHFGWQFRPVLGRPTVEAGLRHMMVVLSLPASDIEKDSNGLSQPKDESPTLSIQVRTRWEPYDKKAQTITHHPFLCWEKCTLERQMNYAQLPPLEVPRTLTYQKALIPDIQAVKWLPTDNGTGVAVVTGKNFFPGTTVRLGNKTYTGNNDGLTLKSDDELEITAPLTAALVGGAVSGRYGEARALKNESSHKYASRIDLLEVKVYPEGPDDVQLTAKLLLYPPTKDGHTVFCYHNPTLNRWFPVDETGEVVKLADIPRVDPKTFEDQINHPGLLLNGVPTATSPELLWNQEGVALQCDQAHQQTPLGSIVAELQAIVPGKDIKGSTVVSVVFPFEDFRGRRSGISYDPALNIVRLGSDDTAKLLITSTDPGDQLCDSHWSVQLDRCEIPFFPGGAVDDACKAPPAPAAKKGAKKEPPPIQATLRCMDATSKNKLDLDISAIQLKSYKQLLLVHRKPQDGAPSAIVDTRLGAIPDVKPKPPAPAITKGPTPASVQQYSSQTIEIGGTNLDQIKTVLFDKTQLKIVNQDAGSLIISIPSSMTQKQAIHDQIQLLSDQNDPVLVNLDVTANPAAAKKEK